MNHKYQRNITIFAALHQGKPLAVQLEFGHTVLVEPGFALRVFREAPARRQPIRTIRCGNISFLIQTGNR